ncbi:hypothetical protein D920_01957 [Enterococcus faecalis 13-SD-W-01]|nr:hypothetical protein D920_01957 [Enterococcus faecalis 13-SD-W-01]
MRGEERKMEEMIIFRFFVRGLCDIDLSAHILINDKEDAG